MCFIPIWWHWHIYHCANFLFLILISGLFTKRSLFVHLGSIILLYLHVRILALELRIPYILSNANACTLNNNFNFIYLRASLTAHRPITKRARREKMHTNKNKKQKQNNNDDDNNNNNNSILIYYPNYDCHYNNNHRHKSTGITF
jgi:hypothetical protein